ncbi:GRAM domain containing [Aspergillus affinis]|uniref:GRAM domain containing n=1 Tax=Aspergillus affinis TaxID=1070780 RepID=UPI0022FE4B19|nr:GRAM domain containing [Aspergillus affinis]KAI9044315.1 GRAM domain containing [Aspergillus affinis]
MDHSEIPEPPPVPSPEPRAPNKIGRSKTSPIDSETMDSSGRSNGRSSIDSTSDRPKSQAGETSDSAKAGPSGFSKLLASRRKKKNKKESQSKVDELPTQFEIENDSDAQEARSESRDGASSVLENPGAPEPEAVNLLTDDSEPDRTPPLTSHNSHSGFYTSSSPLINTTSVDVANDTDGVQADVESAISGLSAAPSHSESNPDTELSRPTSQPTAGSLNIPGDQSSKKRGVSPGRRFRNAFSSNPDKKKDSNRERASSTASGESKKSTGPFGNRGRKASVSSNKKAPSIITEPVPPLPPTIRTDLIDDKPSESSDGPSGPRTPPHTALPAPQTTVTPPTPQIEHRDLFSSPDSFQSKDSQPSEIVVSPSGNMISHRRVRSASSASHKPSKLSNSISAIGPTIEETKVATRTPSAAQQSGFFSSVFSAAQNAATSFSNSLNAQSKARGLTPAEMAEADPSLLRQGDEDTSLDANKNEDSKPSAIDTLGSGDLDFSHLDIAIPPGGSVSTPDGVVITKPDLPLEKRKNTTVHERDEQAAKIEHRRAQRAVTMAYERPSEVSIVPPSDDSLELRSSVSLPRDPVGDQTPPPGSVLDGEGGGTRPTRSGSVRSRLARRRHRGSSGATTSTIGAIGASAIALGVPGANTSMPRLTGFAVASKKRNRDFHSLFRSVPEDDYLIEDYSCALQREIILAGRIYISEGHICFSSNILGWVTTLVISFDEIVAIEKESTAMVFPNAIAIQTLHARHTFRSLLSRESTYDLMVNIWKINHPTLKSSVNGTRVTEGTGDKTEKAGESDAESEDEDEVYDEDEEGDNAESFFEPDGSLDGSERSAPVKGPSRQASGLLNGNGATSTAAAGSGGDAKGKSGDGDGDTDFPGPATHTPTEYTDPSGQYDKVIKDEVIPAPLGKVYSYIFGPASTTFMPKFLVDNQKSGELQFEIDKGGLSNDKKTRNYSYIKPLNGSIGPKQTKCISTETLDFFDLEKAVLVTLSTQTPDVPSGNVFSTMTKYLFTWAPNNQTRFLMTCTIEWTGKSWLKTPIEKGAIDGQGSFGTELINALKTAVVPRRAVAKPTGKGKGRRKKTDLVAEEAAAAAVKAASEANAREAESWGFLEPLHQLLGPVSDIVKPLLSGNIALMVIGVLLLVIFFRGSSRSSSVVSHDIGCPGYSLPQRLAAYEEMWRREESELWSWLEDRVGMDGMAFPTVNRPVESQTRQRSRKVPGDRQVIDMLGEEKMSDREMGHAIRTTRERLDSLEKILNQRKLQSATEQGAEHTEL